MSYAPKLRHCRLSLVCRFAPNANVTRGQMAAVNQSLIRQAKGRNNANMESQPTSTAQSKKRTIWEPDEAQQAKNWRENVLRVAVYIRVSTDSDDQLNSFENQKTYYEDFVQRYPNWKYVGLYDDEAKSGTSTKNRANFQRMLKDCKDGKIDLVVTKDVSRFARNTVDCLNATRELLRLTPPVGVYFDSTNINTLDVGSEIFLSIYAMFAQADSEQKSKSVKIGQAENNRKGQYLCPTDNLLGYTKLVKYGMEIEPKGAKAVQLIYKLFLSGTPAAGIAEIMKSIKAPTGGSTFNWTSSNVSRILRNERYAGIIVAQKEYIEDIFTKKAIKNTGTKRMFYEEDHHDAIVSEKEHVRALMLLKSNFYSPCFNLHYEIEVIRKGLLQGFIPLNITFGGYDAEYYLGALVNANIPEIQFEDGYIRIPKSVNAEMFGSVGRECLTISKGSIAFNTYCVQYMDCEYIEILLHPEEKLIALRKISPKNPNAVPLSAKSYPAAISRIIYDLMGWRRDFRHRIIADIFERDGRSVLIFNLSNSEYLSKSKRQLPADWLDVFDEPRGKHLLTKRLYLAEKLTDWNLQAKAAAVKDFNTCVPATKPDELEKLTREVEEEYVGWEPPQKRRNNNL